MLIWVASAMLFGVSKTNAQSLSDNSGFELTGSANTTGVATAALGYTGAGTAFGTNVNSLRWVGNVNGTSPFNAPIRNMQVLAIGAAARVSWVESLTKAKAGSRYILLEGTNSCLDLRAAGGGAWSTVLSAGKTYEVAVWADTASAAASSFELNLQAGAKIVRVLGLDYQYFKATQVKWTGTPSAGFVAGDFNGWTEANATLPNWRRFTFQFSIPATATAAQIDQLSLIYSAGTNSGPVVLDDAMLYEAIDYGDFSGFATASSLFNSQLKIGALAADAEPAAQNNAAANGDDILGVDDEDGVTQSTLRAGQAGTITVNVTNTSGAAAFLNVWADWNLNNIVDAGEQLATNTSIAAGASNSNQVLNVTPPVTTATGNVPLRARFTTLTGATFAGAFSAGEVEDQLIAITAPNMDFGDFSGFAQATSIANGTIKLGVNAADAEVSLTGNTSANVDDTTGTDDEDGVTHSTLRANQAGTITVNVTNTSGAAAFLNVWADWNLNNIVDAGEQIATNTSIANGVSNSNQVLPVTPPATTATGTVPVRARFTNTATPGFSNAFPGTTLGEVEDHLVTITAPDQDFGDFSGFAQATSVANAGIRMGVNASDAEATLTGNTSANADDTTGTDDEDGVTQSTLRANQSGTITVNVTNTSGAAAFLNVWIDWNLNNIVDAGEQIATDTNIANAVSNSNQVLTVTPPVTVAAGTVPLRARFTSTAAPGFSNVFPGTTQGEVEDHLITITGPDRDFGDWNGAGAATTTAFATANSNLRIGATVDTEATLVPNATATADGADEDGVTMPLTMMQGVSVTLPVSVFNNTGGNRFLHAWIDFNNDGTFNDTVVTSGGERLEAVRTVATGATAATQNITFTVPAAASVGTLRGVRVRVTDSNVTTPTTAGGIGEVEDYIVEIVSGTDFGDFNGFGVASSVFNSTIRLGVNAADAEVSLTGNAAANADDTTGIDDEDGVTQSTLRANQSGTITVNVSNTSGAAAFLNVWVDWNLNNTVDAGEQIATNTSIANGVSNSNQVLTVTPPAATATGAVPVRARFTALTGATFTGTFSTGEVEDHLVTITAPDQDFGDFSGFAQATSVANAGIRMGVNAADAEATLTGNTSANVDDTTGTDDEDGVTQSTLRANQAGTITVNVTNTSGAAAFLNVWIDWNLNNIVDAGEQIATDTNIANAVSNSNQVLTVTPPVTVAAGTVPLRARFTSTAAPGFSNVFPGTTQGEVEDHLITITGADRDFGDWNGAGAATTTAFATANSNLRIGATVDTEATVVPNATATADGADEDGVTMPLTMMQGVSVTLPVSVFNNTGGNRFLHAWIDFNNDGTFNDTVVTSGGERLEAVRTVATGATAATQNVTFTVPATASVGTQRGVRVRVTDSNTTTPTTAGGVGEVEDYIVEIVSGTDFGDFNGFGLASSVFNSTIMLGANAADAEVSITANAAANADDTTGIDDEDGVTHSTLRANQSGTITVNVTNTSGAAAFLNVWVDWNLNNTVDAGEQIATNTSIATGVSNSNQVLTVTPPAATATGTVPVRARFTALTGATFTGAFSTGEVEDHLVTITAPDQDFGDFSGFAQATSVANAGIRMGVNAADAEATLTGNTSANADDTTGTDDEDGVTQSTLRANQSGTITVNVTNTSGAAAFLNVWIDWNLNNIVDAGEQIATDTNIANAVSNSNQVLTVTPPVTVAAGTIPLRARFTSTAAPGFSNTFPGTTQGEVEDHLITITGPDRDFGDWNGAGAATTTAFATSNSNLRIGATVDTEATVVPNATATADGADEDGVTMPLTMMQGVSVTLPVSVFNNTGGNRFLHAWIDFNNDGTFNDTVVTSGGERLEAVRTVATGATAATQNITFTVPAAASVGTLRGVRVRVTDSNVTTPTTAGGVGEVEDYIVEIVSGTDFGDFNGFGVASSVFNSTIRLGVNAADAEVSLTGNAAANADDTTGIDDEDGVTQSTLRANQSGTITVNVSNTSGAAAFLNVWADWNLNNAVDAGEQIATNTSIANGVSNSNQVLTVTPPAATATGTIPLRARFTALTGATFTGAFSTGEVEDHLVTITAPDQDFGDFSGFAQATSVANAGIRMGVNAADAEATLTGNTSANVDDTTGTDDEDGVTQSTLRANQSGTITVNVTNTSGAAAFLNVWIDWNLNNIVDAGEQIATDTNIANAVSNSNQVLTVTPPVTVAAGTIPLRARFTSTAAPGFSNVFPGTTQGEVEDHLITITGADRDFGDWNGAGAATTTAFATADANLRIGATVDTEATVVPNATATADGADEDGVTMPLTMMQGVSVTLPVSVFNNTGGNRFLHAWIDFNNDGTFNDTVVTSGGERLEAVRTVATGATAATQNITFTVPAAASVGTQRGVRVRVTDSNITTPTTAGGIGEVEDYIVEIVSGTDFGDFNGFGLASSVFNSTIRLGVNAADAEVSITANAAANADDTTGIDDEDGVTQSTLRANQSGTITVNVTNTSGAAAFLNVWVDWNLNNAVDAGEQIATNTSIANGMSNSNQVLTVTPPAATATGTIPLRARFTAVTGATFTGAFSTGEVEDHLVTITAPDQDFGDFSGFAQATSVANPGIRMGINAADAEATLTGNTSANVDDTTGTDDEDGVTQSTLRANQAGTITVNVTNSSGAAAFLNVWIDWNSNNIADAGEQIATDTNIANAVSNSNQVLTVTPPVTVAAGTVPLRARFTSTAAPGFSNTFPGTTQGEVEDHLITITAPNLDFGDFSGFAQATSVANGTIKLGVNAADAEAALTANVNANADDFNNTDDEDGVTQSTLRAGQDGTITVNVSNTSAGAAFLNVWTDWNKNNAVDVGEQIVTNTSIAAGTTNSNQVLTVPVPVTTATGTVPLRARFTSTASPGFSNTFPGTTVGEVEDHLLAISNANLDFGDYSGFPSAAQAASTNLWVGVTATDTEVTSPADGSATGDDLSATDDEDLVMPTFTVGSSTNLSVSVNNVGSVASRVIVFADWNGDGDVADANETLAAQSVLATSVRTFALTPPAGTTPGTKYIRVRYSFGSATPAFSGASADEGEVEDYSVTVINPTLTLGDLVWSDLDNDGIRDGGEPGLDGLSVELLNGTTNALITSTVTAGGGLYSFPGLTPGSFKVRIPSPPLGHGLTSGTPVSADNGVDNDNNGLQPGGVNTAITTSAVTLGYFTEPGSSGTGIVENTLDIGLAQTMCVGNIVFRDAEENGFFNVGDTLLDGVTVQIFASGADPLSASPVATTTTAGGGRYQLCVRPGSYFIHIPPAMFGSTLSGMAPSLAPASGPVSNLDDNADQNLLPSTKPFIFGASTGVFTLTVGAAPNAAAGETGHQSTSDDSTDTTVNLTLDLGLVALPLAAPVAGMVVAVPSIEQAASKDGVPVSGVELSLHSDVNDNGHLDDSEMAAAEIAATGEDGHFSFESVPLGTYLLVQQPPFGAEPAGDSDGGDATVTKVSVIDGAVTGLDFTIVSAAKTFQDWLQQRSAEDTESQVVKPLLQYALGLGAGDDAASIFQWQWGQDGHADLRVVRRHGDRPDVRVILEGSSDLKQWSALNIAPAKQLHGKSSELLCYQGITTPFVRLKALLDADLNAVAEQVAVSPVFGSSKLSIRSGLQSFSMPFLRSAWFIGRVDEAPAVSGNLGEPCYAEVMVGANVGSRYEIDETASLAESKLVFEGSTAPAAGEIVAVRAHWTLEKLFPVGSFTAGANAEVADRVLFFREGGYRTIWLQAGVSGSAPRWVESTGAGPRAAGQLPLSPDEGVLIHPRVRGVTLSLLGEVRTWKLVHQLKTGTQLVSVGSPVALSPEAAQMTVASGFLSATDAASADGLWFWTGDRVRGGSGYDRYALLQPVDGQAASWAVVLAEATGSGSTTSLPIAVLRPFRAVFLNIRGSSRTWHLGLQ